MLGGDLGLQHLLDISVRHLIQPQHTTIKFFQSLILGNRENE